MDHFVAGLGDGDKVTGVEFVARVRLGASAAGPGSGGGGSGGGGRSLLSLIFVGKGEQAVSADL